MPTPEELLRLVEAHICRTGQTPSAFGLASVGDPNFVHDLRFGREPRRRTVERVLRAIDENCVPETAAAFASATP
jgi:hypothetical protein